MGLFPGPGWNFESVWPQLGGLGFRGWTGKRLFVFSVTSRFSMWLFGDGRTRGTMDGFYVCTD